MPIQPLPTLPASSVIFIDTNIFVYGLNGQSVECARLLERCSQEEVLGVTLLEVVNEATHRFMLAEALQRGFAARASAHSLRKKPDAIPRLHAYWERTERILRMPLLFVPVGEALIRQAQVERVACGLLTNDSLVVACMRHHGISTIASNDGDFGAISGITLFRPDDVA